jgi:hypothetical protein
MREELARNVNKILFANYSNEIIIISQRHRRVIILENKINNQNWNSG